jgi:hypothetical protein
VPGEWPALSALKPGTFPEIEGFHRKIIYDLMIFNGQIIYRWWNFSLSGLIALLGFLARVPNETTAEI